ncbi:hypothetical protein ACP70R_011703 [Stipagrostis hirtigluma subsp. patula]
MPPETSSPGPRPPHPLASPLLLPATTAPSAAAPAPPWREQLTVRGVAVAAALGSLLCVVIHRLNLTVGVIPALNVASGLLAFFLATAWRAAAERLGLGRGRPFTRQENTVIQTCAIACAGLAFSGCSVSYIFAMDRKTYELVGPDYPGNRAQDIKDPSLGWMISFLFAIALVGPFSIVLLRKVMVIDYKLTFPGGTATALMINSLHGKTEADVAGKKVHCLVKSMSISFGWSFFKWFFSGVGDSCGFDNFPTFGLQAFKNTQPEIRFYFNFSPSYVGFGLISPHIVNCSVFLGSVVSWGFLWPFISVQAGHWYPDNLGNTDFRGLYGYKVFIAISIILGDGLYNLVKIFIVIAREFCNMQSKQRDPPVQALEEGFEQLTDEKLQTEVFLKDDIPPWFVASGYIILAAISTAAVPAIFPQLTWYLVLLCYFLAPAIAFCNSYGMGLTNLNLTPTYGKIALFAFTSLVGSDGGVIAGLAACGIIMSIACSAADLMQDFKSGHLTLSSPRAMFAAQLVGIALGCVIAPLTLWLFWTAFDIGDPDGEYKAPFAIMFREMAILGIEGFSALPLHCLEICCATFFLSLAISLLKDVTPANVSRFIPIPMAMAVPFYVGAYFGVDMFIGTVILFAWQKMNRAEADGYAVAVASGLICGDGIWSIPSAVLSMLGVEPPICMSFKPSSASR